MAEAYVGAKRHGIDMPPRGGGPPEKSRYEPSYQAIAGAAFLSSFGLVAIRNTADTPTKE